MCFSPLPADLFVPSNDITASLPLEAFPTTSPCVKVCQLDLQDRCYGCGRTRDEVARWSGMSPDERRLVNRRLGFRGHQEHR